MALTRIDAYSAQLPCPFSSLLATALTASPAASTGSSATRGLPRTCDRVNGARVLRARSWGENGYIRVKRQADPQVCGVDTDPGSGTGCTPGPQNQTVCGECGILSDSAYPIV